MHFIPLSPPTKARRREGRRRGGKEVSGTWPPYSTRRRSGGGRRWSACIKRWNVATLSPNEGETPRGRPKATGGSPVRDAAARRGGRSVARESPQSSTRRRSGGGRRWSTCIKRWNVATLSPRRRGDTARPTQGDRRKPRERRRSPRDRRVGGAGKSSVLHPNPQRGRQAVEHVHQAVERRHALPQAKGRHRAAYQHATRRVSRSIAGMDENAGTAGDALQTWQSRPPGRRPSAGRAGKAWRNHVEAQGIFARGNGRMRPRSGRFERGHGRLSALGGKKQHPLRAPGQVGGAAQTNQCGHLEKIDVVNEIRAHLAAPVTNGRSHAPRSPRHTTANRAARRELQRHAPRSPSRTTANRAARRERESPIGLPCGARRELKRHAPRSPCRTITTLAARRERESPIGPPCGARREQQRHAPRSPRRTTANRAARRERRRKPRGARRRRDEASCVVPPLASDYLPLARCRLTRHNSRSAVCALRSARAA